MFNICYFMVILHSLKFILPLNIAAWYMGMLAIYKQNFGAFTTVFNLNIAMASSIVFFHVLSNEKVTNRNILILTLVNILKSCRKEYLLNQFGERFSTEMNR